MMNTGGDVDIPTPVLCDEMVCEILSRLPVKSLMRFKCVSPRWRSLIEDKCFIDLHHNRSKTRPNLLMVVKDHEKQLLLGNMFEDSVTIHTREKPLTHNKMLQPVNGLICFIDSNHHAVCIYNLSTRLVSPWIKSTVKEVKEHGVEVNHPTYGFGYDPTTKEHKVICVWKVFTIEISSTKRYKLRGVICEILTVGHNSWRRISAVPPCNLGEICTYADGTIYWRKGTLPIWDENSEVIVAFDVGSEVFREIIVPDFISNQIQIDLRSIQTVGLLELDGHVALLNRINSYTIKLWIFNDDKNITGSGWVEDKNITGSGWVEETITLDLPFCRKQDYEIFTIQSVVGRTDEIIVECFGVKPIITLYFYNRKKKTFVDIDINGTSPIRPSPYFCLVGTFAESLLPV